MNIQPVLSKSELPANIDSLRSYAWELTLRVQQLQERLALLLHQRFGQSSEKCSTEIDAIQQQLDELFIQLPTNGQQETTQSAEEHIQTITIDKHTRRRRHPGRNVIPEDIEVQEVVLDIPEEEKTCDCCGKQKTIRFTKERIVVERIPAQYKVYKHLRPVYGCNHCKLGLSVAEPAPTPIPKGLAGPHLLVFVILSKYLYHLPLYRIQRIIFHESRIWFTRSTMDGWLRHLFKSIVRIHAQLMAQYRASPHKHADESHLMVRDGATKGKHHQGRLWVGIGKAALDAEPVAVFYYNQSRSADAAMSFLKGCSPGDSLMVDGCESYTKPASSYGLVVLNCMAHARRKFVDAQKAGYKKDFATLIIRKISQLYRIERLATTAGMSAAQRLALRTRLSVPVLREIKKLLLEPGFVVLPDRTIGKAINYMLNHWEQLTRYCTNGEFPIDNNPVERIIRPLAIGRNNWLCAGSQAGAKWMAAFYSIIATCKLNGINPHDYLLDIVQRLPLRPEGSDIKDLLPVQWAKDNNIKTSTTVEYPTN